MSGYEIRVLKKSEVLRQKMEAGKEKTAAMSRGEIMDFYVKRAQSAEERDEAEETEKTEQGEEEKIAFWRGFERRKRDALQV